MSGRQISASTSLGMMSKRGIITARRISINSYRPEKISAAKPQSVIRKVFSYNYDTPIPVLEQVNKGAGSVNYQIMKYKKLLKNPRFRHACEGRYPELF